MAVHFIDRNTPAAILADIEAEKPEAFVVVWLSRDTEEVNIAGRWQGGRIRAMGMLADALDALGAIGRNTASTPR